MEEDFDFIYANDIKVGSHIILNDRPCKVLDIYKTNDGKHGTTKVHVICMDLFKRKKYKHIFKGADRVKVPKVEKIESQLVFLEGGYADVLMTNGIMKESIKIDEEDLEEMMKKFQTAKKNGNELYITLMTYMDECRLTSCKED